MGFLEQIMGASRAVLTLDAKVQQLDEELAGVHQGVRDLGVRLQEMAERITRLEAFRDADRAEWDARFTQFTAEVKQTLAEVRIQFLQRKSRSKPRRKK